MNRNYIKRLIILFVTSLLWEVTTANVPIGNTKNYSVFKNIRMPYGIGCVNSLLQDENGYIWIGTRHGLQLYNGYRLYECSYDSDNSDFDVLQAIVQLDDDRICCGTDGGIIIFNTKLWKFESVANPLSSIKAVRSILKCNDNLWIGTRDDGFFSFNLKTNAINKISLPNTTVYDICQYNGNVYIGAYDGLYCFNEQKRRITKISLANSMNLMVNSLLVDSTQQCLWVGTESALFQYSFERKENKRIDKTGSNAIKTLCQDNQGNLLLGTDNGLFIFNLNNNSVEHIVHNTRNHESLINNIIWEIIKDRDGNIWFATDGGISIATLSPKYDFYDISDFIIDGSGNSITVVYLDHNNELWLGGTNGLVYIKNESKSIWFNSGSQPFNLTHNHIRDIYEDRDKDIWIASDGSIARYDRRENKFHYYYIEDDKGRKANWAYSIYEDESGSLWIPTYMGGLYVVNKKELVTHNDDIYLSQSFFSGHDYETLKTIYQMIPDTFGNLWVNTWKGVASINIKSKKVSLKNFYADNIFVDGKSIWMSDRGTLYRYDMEKDCREPLDYKIPQGMIYSFVSDGNKIWISSVDGLSIIDTKTKEVIPSYISDANFLSAYYDPISKAIIWGCEDRITIQHVNEKYSSRNRRAFISSINANGAISQFHPNNGNRINVKERTNVAIEFATLKYSEQDDEIFFYRFGDDDKWHNLRKGENQLVFAAMPSGDSKLQVCCTNPETDKDAIVSTYNLNVPYPWYLSISMIILYLIFILIALICIIKYFKRKNHIAFERKEKERSLELSQMKMDFFINISHELKTPLSLIIAPLSKLLSETTNPKLKKSLESIQNNAYRLNTLIYKVLDFRKMEYESDETLFRSNLELNSLIEGCIQNFSTVAHERNIKIDFKQSVDEIWLHIDKIKIESIIINLISNAMKFVLDDYGQIHVSSYLADDEVFVTISDNGKGIKEKDLPMIFTRYYQGNDGANTKGGTGLGLYLVKKYIEMHEGSVSVKNDHGAVFTIILPNKGQNRITTISEDSLDLMQEDNQKRILIVDDNIEIVDFLTEALSSQYCCMKAYDGKAGLDLVKEWIPDVVIVDQMMPVMSGLEFVKAIRHDKTIISLPIIMLTAKDDTTTEIESIKSGVDIFMPKPFDLKKLQLQIVRLINKYSQIQESIHLESLANTNFAKSQDCRSYDEIFLESAIKLIDANMENEDFNVKTLASLLAVDPKKLYRKIKQLTGYTPVSYIRKLRMKKAAVLLKENKYSISEVMYLVGYTNASYFTKSFNDEFGVNPKDYCKTQQ